MTGGAAFTYLWDNAGSLSSATIANRQVELKDTKAARRTLEELVKAHPQSEAAGAARERLSRLR